MKDLTTELALTRELARLKKVRIYSQDYVIKNFTEHLRDAKAIRQEMLAEVDKLNVDILTCIKNIEERKSELNKEYKL